MIYVGDDYTNEQIAELIGKNQYTVYLVENSEIAWSYETDSLNYITSLLNSTATAALSSGIQNDTINHIKPANILQNSLKINTMTSTGSFSIGNCISAELTFTLFEKIAWLTQYTELALVYQVVYENMTYYVMAGKYIVENIQHSKYSHKVTCYDFMSKFDEIFMYDPYVYAANIDLYMTDSGYYPYHKVKGFLLWLYALGYPVEDSSGNLFTMVNSSFYRNNIPQTPPDSDNWLQTDVRNNTMQTYFDYGNNGGTKYTMRDVLRVIGQAYGINWVMDERGYLAHTAMYKYTAGITFSEANTLNYTLGDSTTLIGYRLCTNKNEYVKRTSESGNYAIIATSTVTTTAPLTSQEFIKSLYGEYGGAQGVYNKDAYQNITRYDMSFDTIGNALVQAGDYISLYVDSTYHYGYVTECTNTTYGTTHIVCKLDKNSCDKRQVKTTFFTDSQYNEIKNILS